jgi:hypothetical protein
LVPTPAFAVAPEPEDSEPGVLREPEALPASDSTEPVVTQPDAAREPGATPKPDVCAVSEFEVVSEVGVVSEVEVVSELGSEPVHLTCGAVTAQRARRHVATAHRLLRA